MGVARVVQGDDGFTQSRRVARIEGGVPLPVFLPEAHDHDVGLLDQRARSDGVDARALAVFPERFFLITEDGHAAVVTRAVVRDGGEKGDTGSPAFSAPSVIRSRQSVCTSPER